MRKKNITINDLAVLMKTGFKEFDQKMKTGFEEFDQKMKTGFELVDQKMEKRFAEVDQKIDELACLTQKEFLNMNKKIENIAKELKSEIKNVKIDLNKKVYIFDHKDLEFRVEKLEEKEVAKAKQ